MIFPYYDCGTYSTTNSVQFDRVVCSSASLWFRSLSLVEDAYTFSHPIDDEHSRYSILSMQNYNTTGSHPI